MNGLDCSDPGQRVFVVLGELFEKDPMNAVDTAAQVVGLVANFYADSVVLSGDRELRIAALNKLRTLEDDIADLNEHMKEFVSEVVPVSRIRCANDNREICPRCRRRRWSSVVD